MAFYYVVYYQDKPIRVAIQTDGHWLNFRDLSKAFDLPHRFATDMFYLRERTFFRQYRFKPAKYGNGYKWDVRHLESFAIDVDGAYRLARYFHDYAYKKMEGPDKSLLQQRSHDLSYWVANHAGVGLKQFVVKVDKMTEEEVSKLYSNPERPSTIEGMYEKLEMERLGLTYIKPILDKPSYTGMQCVEEKIPEKVEMPPTCPGTCPFIEFLNLWNEHVGDKYTKDKFTQFVTQVARMAKSYKEQNDERRSEV